MIFIGFDRVWTLLITCMLYDFTMSSVIASSSLPHASQLRRLCCSVAVDSFIRCQYESNMLVFHCVILSWETVICLLESKQPLLLLLFRVASRIQSDQHIQQTHTAIIIIRNNWNKRALRQPKHNDHDYYYCCSDPEGCLFWLFTLLDGFRTI